MFAHMNTGETTLFSKKLFTFQLMGILRPELFDRLAKLGIKH